MMMMKKIEKWWKTKQKQIVILLTSKHCRLHTQRKRILLFFGWKYWQMEWIILVVCSLLLLSFILPSHPFNFPSPSYINNILESYNVCLLYYIIIILYHWKKPKRRIENWRFIVIVVIVVVVKNRKNFLFSFFFFVFFTLWHQFHVLDYLWSSSILLLV